MVNGVGLSADAVINSPFSECTTLQLLPTPLSSPVAGAKNLEGEAAVAALVGRGQWAPLREAVDIMALFPVL